MNDLMHEGVGHLDDPPGRGSGRYGWGTGENPYQHQFSFRSEVAKMRKGGLTDAQIAKALIGENATGVDLKAKIAIEEKSERSIKMSQALQALDKAKGNKSAAARMLGIPISSFNKLVDPKIAETTNKYQNIADYLKNKVSEKGIIDITKGTGLTMGVTDYTKNVAVSILENEGYIKAYCQIPQASGGGKKTTITVLCPPGTEYFNSQYDGKPYINWRKNQISQILDYTPDGSGKTWWTPKYPESMSSDRVKVRYAEDGGVNKDGVIEIRKGVKDLSLGKSMYAQVRVMVDNDHYMKGMAIYADDADFPPGVDVIYNTNKKRGASFEKVFKGCKVSGFQEAVAKKLGLDSKLDVDKQIKEGHLTIDTVDDLVDLGFTRKQARGFIDKENPFGAAIKAGGQNYYEDANGKQKQSVINKLQEEGDWDSWSRTLSSQFLFKQPIKLIKQQLGLSVDNKRMELEKIKELTNPVLKQKMLDDFARTCDANASDLSAKGFKNQAFQVLLPNPKMKETEIYAPNYKDGDRVALIRYPHGGIFEIPILKVNNRDETSKKFMGNASDAVAIHPKVAEQLSGADFDGDTALVIPLDSNRINVASRKPLQGLIGFDTKTYKLPDGAPPVTNRTKQRQIGETTNLIVDMTIAGAPWSDIEKAVKHSMVAVDSMKHHLDWKQSLKDNNIIELKKEYQGINPNGTAKGASTIISQAGSDAWVNSRRVVTDVKKMTPEEKDRWDRGYIIYRDSGKTKNEKVEVKSKRLMTSEERERFEKGEKIYRNKKTPSTEKVSKMDIVDDAMDLVRDKSNEKEVAYANYANELKEIAREARRESRGIKNVPVSRESKITYAPEVRSLKGKVQKAQLNAPRERQAQYLMNNMVAEIFKSNPGMDHEHKQRARGLAIKKARAIVGAGKPDFEITDREWEAIQSNAVSTSLLKEIFRHTNQDKLKERATPKNTGFGLRPYEVNVAKSMYSTGMYTLKEIAERFGVSPSTISKAIKE